MFVFRLLRKQQIHKLQIKDTRKMKKQGNTTPPKVHKSSITESKDI
jgi:hypothetical protein